MLSDLLGSQFEACDALAEFGDAQMEVTKVCFSPVSNQRLFAASLDKTLRVYDLPSKQLLKQIQSPSPILLMTVDFSEKFVYLACDNLNVY